jgi:5-bromo-4-chloroindolyl phosphate hydrolysis protein
MFMLVLIYSLFQMWKGGISMLGKLRLQLQKLNSKITSFSSAGVTFASLFFFLPVLDYLMLYFIMSGLVGISVWYLIFSDKAEQDKLKEQEEIDSRITHIQTLITRARVKSPDFNTSMHWKELYEIISKLRSLSDFKTENTQQSRMILNKWIFPLEDTLEKIAGHESDLALFRSFDIQLVIDLNKVLAKDLEKINRGEKIEMEINMTMMKDRMKHYLSE